MNLRVLNVAFPFAPVRPDAVGGAEQVVRHIDAALVAAGHRSSVVAQAQSQVQGRLVPVDVAPDSVAAEDRRRAWVAYRETIAATMHRHEIDVVHMHGLDFHEYLPAPGRVPILVTLHLPPAWYPREVFSLARDDVFLHCVSPSQHRDCPASASLLPPIENGVPVRRRATRARRHAFALALGRIAPEKNWHAALDAARIAGVPMLLAGRVFPYAAHERYFTDEIQPRLDSARRFTGALGTRAKQRLLSRARCLLVPSLAPETSSLVAMEALACGTPVIAYPSGALRDIVEHGVTGFIVNSPPEMAQAIANCESIDRAQCHAAARERFCLNRSMQRYIDAYRHLIEAGRARQ